MASQHPEAMSPATSTPVWALIFVHPHAATNSTPQFVVASSWAVTSDCQEVGWLAGDDLGISCGLEPGFHLWEGTIDFDGLDGIDYEGTDKVISFKDAEVWFAKHEASPPDSGIVYNLEGIIDSLLEPGEKA